MAVSPLVIFGVAVALLVAANLLNNRFAPSAYMVTSPVAAALLLVLYGLAGGDWAAAGFGRAELGRGLRWGLVLAVLVAVGYLVGALVPATRGVFVDRRVERASVGQIAYQTLARIPLGTVLLEEIAFRGVLYGLLRSPYGTVWATIMSAALFGLWHVLPAAGLSRLNPSVGRMFRPHPAMIVPVTVAATAVVGVVLCELQRRSGSLAAPAAVHWAVNARGMVTAFLVTRRLQARGARPG